MIDIKLFFHIDSIGDKARQDIIPHCWKFWLGFNIYRMSQTIIQIFVLI